jgi:phospholipid/cholesterol/gamma-HCH transport system substrate-binding protein
MASTTTSASSRTEILTGIFVFCGLALLAGLVLQFSNIKEAFRETYPLTVSFDDSGGLMTNGPVRFGGTRVGRVQEILPRIVTTNGISINTGVNVKVLIYKDYNIPQGALISLAKEGLLGDSYVSISPPAQPVIGILKAGDEIKGREAGGLDDLQETAQDVAKETQRLLGEIRTGLHDLNSAIGKLDREILSDTNLTHLRDSLTGLSNTMKKVDEQILSETNTEALKSSLRQLDTASANVAASSLKLDGLMNRAGTAIDQLGQGATTFKESGAAFKKAAESAGRTAGDINFGDGLFSALIHDAQLRQDFKNLIANLKERGIVFYKDKSAERGAPSPLSPSQSKPSPTPTRPNGPSGR